MAAMKSGRRLPVKQSVPELTPQRRLFLLITTIVGDAIFGGLYGCGGVLMLVLLSSAPGGSVISSSLYLISTFSFLAGFAALVTAFLLLTRKPWAFRACLMANLLGAGMVGMMFVMNLILNAKMGTETSVQNWLVLSLVLLVFVGCAHNCKTLHKDLLDRMEKGEQPALKKPRRSAEKAQA